MSSNSLRKGWISRRDIRALPWSSSEKQRAIREVTSAESGIPEVGVARSLEELNSWARANGLVEIQPEALARELEQIRAAKLRRNRSKPQRNYVPFTDRQSAAELAREKGLWFSHSSEANQAGFLSAKQLEARLWTPTLIEGLLGEPDRFGSNPHSRRNAMRFWSISRLDLVEQSQQFSREMSKSIRRRSISWEEALARVAASDRKLYGADHSTAAGWLRVFGSI